VDYYALLRVRRGCTRSELEHAHLVLTLKLKPDRSVSFAERLELVDEHRDLEAVRDQARMSALFLYRMLQKGYSFIMSAVLDEEAAERQRGKDAAAAAALAAMAESEPKQQEEEEEVATMPEKPVPVPVPESVPVAIANGGNVLVTTKPEPMASVIPMPRTVVTAATAATPLSPPFQGVFCRDMAVVGTLLSRGGFDRPIPVKCEAMSC